MLFYKQIEGKENLMKFLLTLILPMFLMLGCGVSGSSSESTSSEYLQVSESTKSGSSSLVPVESYIVLTFTTEINKETVNSSTVYLLDENNTHVPMEVNASGDSISIVPNEYLFEDCQYTIVVTTELEDVLGRSLEENFTYMFRTVSNVDTIAPIIDGQTHSYNENQVADTVVATVTASDNVGVVAYTFNATNTQISADDYFTINNEGNITITNAGIASEMNDFEDGSNTTDYNITATDAAGNSNTATVTLNVTDINEEAVTYTIGGTASGLEGTVELHNASETIAVLNTDTDFIFTTEYTDGTDYNVSIVSQPSNQNCTLSNNIDTINSANVTNVELTCTTDLTRIDTSLINQTGLNLKIEFPQEIDTNRVPETGDYIVDGVTIDASDIRYTGGTVNITLSSNATALKVTISGQILYLDGSYHNNGLDATYDIP